MFASLVKGLNEQGGAVRAYDACARAARGRVASEPENAAALLLIAFAAQRFVDAYDDQPLTVEVAGAEFDQFKSYVDTLDEGFSKGTADARLAALNAVAAKFVAAAKS